MLIRYKGGRSRYEVSINRKPYYFIPENNKILDTNDQAVINYIFALPNRAEFEVVNEPQQEIPIKETTTKNKCEECGFIAKSEQGLLVHQSKHRKGGK